MALERIKSLWHSLEPRGQITIAGIALATVATFYFLFHLAGAASYSTLESGVDPSKVGQMTQALNSAGISYKLENGGTEIQVPSSQESNANVALAEKGLSGTTQEGMAIFNTTSLATTDFQQQVDYQRAVEGELDNAIMQIDGVTNADVELVIPDDTLFVDQGPKASASVLLTTDQTLDPTAVSGIAHLVASAVKGLNTSGVTITDQTGTLLWPNPEESGSLDTNSTLEAEQTYSAELGAQITSMLDQTLGPNKAIARVEATLDTDQTTLDKTTYAKKGTPLSTQTSNESLNSTGGGTVTPANTGTTTTPTYSATSTGSNSKSNYKDTSGSTAFGVDKTVQRTVVAPGTVQRLDVALVLDSSVPKAEVASIKQSVASLAGIDPKRGDTLSVETVKFAPTTPTTTSAPASGVSSLMKNPLNLAKYGGLGLACLAFLFAMTRKLKRSEREGIAPEPTWLREINRAAPVAELEATRVRGELTDPAAQKTAALRAEAGEIVKRQPEQIAQQVGQWLKE